MVKQVLVSLTASKQLKELGDAVKGRVKSALSKYSKTGAGDTKRLHGIRGKEDLIRLRVGDYRVVFREDAFSIRVTQVFHRSRGYGWLE